MGQKRETFESCEVGDWCEWSKRPNQRYEIYGYQRSLQDFDVENGMIKVQAAKEWTWKKDVVDGKDVWRCIKIGRADDHGQASM